MKFRIIYSLIIFCFIYITYICSLQFFISVYGWLFFVLDNQRGFTLGKNKFSSRCSHWFLMVFCLRRRPGVMFSLQLWQKLLKSCWGNNFVEIFMEITSLSQSKDTLSRQNLRYFGSYNLLSPLLWWSLSLRFVGCTIDMSNELFTVNYSLYFGQLWLSVTVFIW